MGSQEITGKLKEGREGKEREGRKEREGARKGTKKKRKGGREDWKRKAGKFSSLCGTQFPHQKIVIPVASTYCHCEDLVN